MSLFKKFEEKAKQKIGRIEEENPYVDTKKFIPLKQHKDFQIQSHQPFQGSEKDMYDYDLNNPQDYDPYDDLGYAVQAQKPEGFHEFILANQYEDIELLIRGFKKVYDKGTKEWVIRRRDSHCYTDEQSEQILRTIQAHFSPDIKLGFATEETFNILMQMIYDEIDTFFTELEEYTFGRFREEKQAEMKRESHLIFNAVMPRIRANYSRSVKGWENIATHQSIKGQESLNQPDRKKIDRNYTY